VGRHDSCSGTSETLPPSQIEPGWSETSLPCQFWSYTGSSGSGQDSGQELKPKAHPFLSPLPKTAGKHELLAGLDISDPEAASPIDSPRQTLGEHPHIGMCLDPGKAD